MKSVLAAALLVACAAGGHALAKQPGEPPAPPQNHLSDDPLFDYKLRVSRAERAHQEMLDAADEMTALASDLSKRLLTQGAFGPDDNRSIERLRKLARRVRSDLGGSGDPKMEDPPSTIRDAAVVLADRSDAVASQIHKASRFEINTRLIELTGDIQVLGDILKQLQR